MAIVGQPYHSGNSEIIVTKKYASPTLIPEGTAVMLDSNGDVVKSDAKGFAGIAGISHAGCISFVAQGLSIPVVLKAGTAVKVGGACVIDSTGALTSGDGTFVGVFSSPSTTTNTDSEGTAVALSANVDIGIGRIPIADTGGSRSGNVHLLNTDNRKQQNNKDTSNA